MRKNTKVSEDPADRLAIEIEEGRRTGQFITASLETSERVLARITDGIYRQPSSALRELISNAYDADASFVVIHTDAPRFDKISIRDNGNGMSEKALAVLIKHIGGSPKRTYEGAEFGVVNRDNPMLSPGGRKLIGKIGIGLFAVSQLSRHFQIITKTKGSNYRTIVDVIMKTFTEDELSEKKGKKKIFETGEVKIESRLAEDVNTHGTEIIILDLHPQTKRELQSKFLWEKIDFDLDQNAKKSVEEPIYHVGRLDEATNRFIKSPNFPWDNSDDAEIRFTKMVDAVVNEYGKTVSDPSLETIFDNYLQMFWTLSLSTPLDYIDKHPFDITQEDDMRIFEVGNEKKSQAREIKLSMNQTIRQKIGLISPERGSHVKFELIIDGVKLFRPILINNQIMTSHAIKNPLLFIGKYTPDLSNIPKSRGGGDFSFEAYILWSPKIIPKENRGCLIRISDASSGLFDETFMKYQVSEQSRLRKMTAEIFVNKGLEPALNIDRESFNFSHAHFQILTKWLHGAIRQFTNKHKTIAKEIRQANIIRVADVAYKEFELLVKKEVLEASQDENEDIPEVRFLEKDDITLIHQRKEGTLVFKKDDIFSGRKTKTRGKSRVKVEIDEKRFENQIEALIKLLNAFNVFDNMPYDRQQELIRRIVNIFSYEDNA